MLGNLGLGDRSVGVGVWTRVGRYLGEVPDQSQIICVFQTGQKHTTLGDCFSGLGKYLSRKRRFIQIATNMKH